MVAREPYRSLSGLALAPWRLSPGCRAVAGPEPSRSLDIYTETLHDADSAVKQKLTPPTIPCIPSAVTALRAADAATA